MAANRVYLDEPISLIREDLVQELHCCYWSLTMMRCLVYARHPEVTNVKGSDDYRQQSNSGTGNLRRLPRCLPMVLPFRDHSTLREPLVWMSAITAFSIRGTLNAALSRSDQSELIGNESGCSELSLQNER